ncbi:esterase-like activity of phytase family protein [Streptomyces sp. NPDC127039]|uniref:esterase-like activity of phytase family protein n=1 Tax=Streptomyces sp. NPDC127039 TaxID=3347115 RepID=UPI00365D8C19
MHARPQGGVWLAVEGGTGAGDKLVRLDARGVTRQVVPLPADVAAGLGKQGFEGVTATTDWRRHEVVWAALRRESAGDPAGVVRLARYDVTVGTWSWYGYRLEPTGTAGDWMGLSEITAVGDRLAVTSATSSTAPPPGSNGSTPWTCRSRRRPREPCGSCRRGSRTTWCRSKG